MTRPRDDLGAWWPRRRRSPYAARFSTLACTCKSFAPALVTALLRDVKGLAARCKGDQWPQAQLIFMHPFMLFHVPSPKMQSSTVAHSPYCPCFVDWVTAYRHCTLGHITDWGWDIRVCASKFAKYYPAIWATLQHKEEGGGSLRGARIADQEGSLGVLREGRSSEDISAVWCSKGRDALYRKSGLGGTAGGEATEQLLGGHPPTPATASVQAMTQATSNSTIAKRDCCDSVKNTAPRARPWGGAPSGGTLGRWLAEFSVRDARLRRMPLAIGQAASGKRFIGRGELRLRPPASLGIHSLMSGGHTEPRWSGGRPAPGRSACAWACPVAG